MFLLMVISYACISFGTKLVEYRLGYNYGEVFHDFSGNGRDGVNGDSSSTSSKNTIATDRGSYFNNDNSQIILPSNDQQSTPFTIPSTFTIASWVIATHNQGLIFYRYKDSNNYFYLMRDNNNDNMIVRIKISGSDTNDVNAPHNSWDKSKFYLDVWNLISIVGSGNSMKFYQNNILQLTLTLPGGASSYSESGTYVFYIGSNTSIKGIIWYFVITDDSTFQSSLVISSSSSNCLTPSCVTDSGNSLTSYAPAIIDPYLGTGYLSENRDWDENSGNINCPGSSSSCYGNVQMICICSSGSCIFSTSSNTNICWCLLGFIGTATSCICPTGFYLVGSNCCETSCATCNSGSLLCLTCIASNSTPDLTQGCKCDAGYWGTSPLTSSSSCSACYSECATCNQDNICLTCKSSHAYADSIQGCKCNIGYYMNVDVCESCHSTCLTCNGPSETNCESCVIVIPALSYFEGTCKCPEKHYWNGMKCQVCSEKCLTCTGSLITNCLTCVSNRELLGDNSCECKIGFYWDGGTCVSCDSPCRNCIGSSITCSECYEHASLQANSTCICDENYAFNGDYCIPHCNTNMFFDKSTEECNFCNSKCLKCESLSLCTLCIENSSLANNICECNQGYSGQDLCERSLFSATLKVFSNNTISLIFSEELNKSLTNSDIFVQIYKDELKFNLNELDLTNYWIESIQVFELTGNTSLLITFLNELTSNLHSLLSTKTLTSKLFENVPMSDEEKAVQEQISKDIAATTATVGLSASLGASFLSLDPNSFFNFINTAEMFYVVYLFNLDLIPQMSGFLVGMRIESSIPNLFEQFIDKNEGGTMPEKLEKYGFKSTIFLLDVGVRLSVFCVMLSVALVLFTITRIRRCKDILETVLGMFKYGVFLRAWVQLYFELLSAAAICFLHLHLKKNTEFIDFSIAIAFIVIDFIGMIFLIQLLKRRSMITEEQEVTNFVSKFSTFFEEFKDKKTSDRILYLLYILRRNVLVTSIVFINDGMLQLIISFVCCLLTLVYVFCVFPFKTTITNVYHCINELTIIAFHVSMIISANSQILSTKESTAEVCKYLVMLAWGLNIVISTGLTLFNVIQRIKKWLLNRKPKILPISGGNIIKANDLIISQKSKEKSNDTRSSPKSKERIRSTWENNDEFFTKSIYD